MKGIVLAGGQGFRLHPLTSVIPKVLLPVYDKPMIYYPISVLMMAGIRDILIIATPEHLLLFRRLLKNGHDLGMRFEYVEQPQPDGLATAFRYGECFLGGEDACLILGDNAFYYHDLYKLLNLAFKNCRKGYASIFAYKVSNPTHFGVVEMNDNTILSLEEKPDQPKSNYAITGLYCYPADVVKVARQVVPSERGEYEITSLNQIFFKMNRLLVQKLPNDSVWLDVGTHENLHLASQFVEIEEKISGKKIACLEEIALEMGFIDNKQFTKVIQKRPKASADNQYEIYLKNKRLK